MNKFLESGIVHLKSLIEEKNMAIILISACRGFIDMFPEYFNSEKSPEQKEIDIWKHSNNQKTTLLEAQIKRNSFGYIRVLGGYIEENIGPVEEKSFMVFAPAYKQEELFNFAKEMCKIFKQDSVLVIDAETHYAKYINSLGEDLHFLPAKNIFDINQSSLSKYFSKVGTKRNNRRFQIIELEEKLSGPGIIERLSFNSNHLVDSSRLNDENYTVFFEENFKKYLEFLGE